MEPDSRLVLLGYVAGAHGVRGALRVKLHNAESSTLAPGVALSLRPRGAKDDDAITRHEVTRVAPKPGSEMVRLWLAGVNAREAADALRGCEVLIERDALPELDADEFYLDDLVDLPVLRRREPEAEGFDELGTIVGISSNGEQDLLVIRLRGREWLLPAIGVFITDIEADRVIVDVHDDMLPEAKS